VGTKPGYFLRMRGKRGGGGRNLQEARVDLCKRLGDLVDVFLGQRSRKAVWIPVDLVHIEQLPKSLHVHHVRLGSIVGVEI
jgi:hypothetical protein